MAKEANEFLAIDKQVFAIAGLLDAQLRVAGLNAGDFSELELDYLKNWLNKEQDPLLGTIIAQLVGLREVPVPEKQTAGDNNE
tara:strand:- start:1850 stop:2098 length:249 start_codon:yes stop_codon:yes gene_type:complete